MSPADMHKGEVTVDRFMEFSGYFFSEGHSRLIIYHFAVISILMMSTDAVLNATPTIPAEIFGISGNFLAVIIVFSGILIAAGDVYYSSDGSAKKQTGPSPGLTISSLLPSVLLQ